MVINAKTIALLAIAASCTAYSQAQLPPLAGDGVTDDTAAIQARLDSGATLVYLPPPKKCYLISKTLKIGSNQEFKLDRFSVIRLAPQSNCPMLENKGYKGGTNKNVVLTGGIWDFDNTSQAINPLQARYRVKGFKFPKKHDSTFFLGICIRFANLEGLTVKGLTIRNPTTYGIEFSKVSYFLVDDITFDYTTWNPIPLNLDGVHFDGGCHHGKISNLRGTTFDDLVALNANDGICSPEEGPISDIDIDGLYADYCHSAVRILSTGAPLKRVTIRNVHGNFYTYAVGLTHFFANRKTRGVFDDIVISDVFASKVYSPKGIGVNSRAYFPLIWVEGPVDVGSLTIRNFSRDERNISVPLIRVDPQATVRHLTVRDCKVINRLKKPLAFFDIKGKVMKAVVENNVFIDSPGANVSTEIKQGPIVPQGKK